MNRAIRTPISPYEAIRQEMVELQASIAELKAGSRLDLFPPVQPLNNGVFGSETDAGMLIATARSVAPASVVNPNLRGDREIDLVVLEINTY
ncbi:hypothetical protein MBANPS3_012146 [Mucor bainieri]